MTTAAVENASSPVDLKPADRRNRVVVGMDDDPVSVGALRFAAIEAGYRGGDVLALHVWHYPNTWGYPVAWPEEDSLGSYVLTGLQKTVDAVLAERVAAGAPVVAITAQAVQGVDVTALGAAADGAALLVLGTRHHNRFLGSVSQACVNHPPCPVVVVPLTGQPE
jgi:nucleotide-binding universal stress UspA family protein